MSFAADNLLAGDIEHVEGCLIGEFEGSIGTGEDDPDVKIADEGAEALFAFAKGFGGAALLGEVGEGNEYVRDFAGRIELGNGVEKGPDGLLGVEVAPADYTIVNGAAGGDDRGDQAFGIGEDGAILAKRLEVEVDQRFPGYLLDAKFEHVESGGIGVKDFADGAAGDDANVKIFDEGAEAFFAFSRESQCRGGLFLGNRELAIQFGQFDFALEDGSFHFPSTGNLHFEFRSPLQGHG